MPMLEHNTSYRSIQQSLCARLSKQLEQCHKNIGADMNNNSKYVNENHVQQRQNMTHSNNKMVAGNRGRMKWTWKPGSIHSWKRTKTLPMRCLKNIAVLEDNMMQQLTSKNESTHNYLTKRLNQQWRGQILCPVCTKKGGTKVSEDQRNGVLHRKHTRMGKTHLQSCPFFIVTKKGWTDKGQWGLEQWRVAP